MRGEAPGLRQLVEHYHGAMPDPELEPDELHRRTPLEPEGLDRRPHVETGPLDRRPHVETGPLDRRALPPDAVGLLEGLTTTRAIRRYTSDHVPEEALRAMLFAATRAPSGSNRQPFRFVVLTDGPIARQAKQLIARGAQQVWGAKRESDGYDRGSGAEHLSPKARMARTMQQYVDNFANVPVLVLPCLVRYRAPNPMEGASIYPACQNLLLGARALGYGGVFTGMHYHVESELRALLRIPDGVFIAGTITIGKPEGHHGPVRRRPMSELVYSEEWGSPPPWAVDPAGTRHTAAGPPKAPPNP
jgi:nitroreductase